jgi:hypothetical protein
MRDKMIASMYQSANLIPCNTMLFDVMSHTYTSIYSRVDKRSSLMTDTFELFYNSESDSIFWSFTEFLNSLILERLANYA